MENDTINKCQQQTYKNYHYLLLLQAIGTVNVAYALQEMTDTELEYDRSSRWFVC